MAKGNTHVLSFHYRREEKNIMRYEEKLQSSEQNPEECDATKDHSSTIDGQQNKKAHPV